MYLSISSFSSVFHQFFPLFGIGVAYRSTTDAWKVLAGSCGSLFKTGKEACTEWQRMVSIFHGVWLPVGEYKSLDETSCNQELRISVGVPLSHFIPLLCSQYVHDSLVMFCILWRYIIHFWTNLRARRHETQQGLTTLQQKMARGELTWSLSQLLMACSQRRQPKGPALKPWWRHIRNPAPRHQDATLAHHVTLADQSSENPWKNSPVSGTRYEVPFFIKQGTQNLKFIIHIAIRWQCIQPILTQSLTMVEFPSKCWLPCGISNVAVENPMSLHTYYPILSHLYWLVVSISEKYEFVSWDDSSQYMEY
jgi:hypothetical protein